jgi:hypothetical protein
VFARLEFSMGKDVLLGLEVFDNFGLGGTLLGLRLTCEAIWSSATGDGASSATGDGAMGRHCRSNILQRTHGFVDFA